MLPWICLDRAAVPGSRNELRLMQRGTEFSIMLGANELMNSRLSGSEEALATLACERLTRRPRPHVLIGGLGMGFTLRAALAALGDDARVTVAELVPAVIGWARGPMSSVFATSLVDPRVIIHDGDVAGPIAAERSSFDAILLDVDNGPDGLTSSANDALYGSFGLQQARRALRPGGVLAVWSAAPDPSFTARLERAGFAAKTARVCANGKRGGARHVVWLATATTSTRDGQGSRPPLSAQD
ncbi:hypothetical protein [Aureimonas leprariae]|uniref:Spermidine synthase n=1 Tax=Plantimonas leprariae TaxID=2615207 RepID=A0A7V7TVE2_9HYPH|nr:hypothetical protein [Aureimonas leprariae]KAB0678070.1 hypothetical protein F6X38_16730 [Aureimonas leprariae]